MSQSTYPIASLIKRLAALGYDFLLVAALILCVVITGLVINGGDAVEGGIWENLLFVSMIAAWFGFYGYFWVSNGQTLGMQTWRLRVEKIEGGNISWGQAVIRFVVAVGSLGSGFLLMLVHPKKQTLQDLLSNSQVVQLPKTKTTASKV